MMNKLIGLVKEEQGQGMTEYGLVLGVIAIGVVAVLGLLKDEILALFQDTTTELQSVTGTTP